MQGQGSLMLPLQGYGGLFPTAPFSSLLFWTMPVILSITSGTRLTTLSAVLLLVASWRSCTPPPP